LPGISPGEDAAWQALTRANPSDVYRMTLARYDESAERYVLRILGEDYGIFPRHKVIERLADRSASLNLDFRLMVLTYLTNARDIELSRKLVQCRQLRGGDNFFRGVHNLPVVELETRFGSSLQLFRQVCLSLDGKEVSYGDVAIEIKVLPKLPLTFILWVADDEFPARVSILFDSTADEHLPLDALLAAVRTAVKRIIDRSTERWLRG